MPFGVEGVESAVGHALSGGGFCATLCHGGALGRLDELGSLGRLDRVSSVSGGSITAGVLATRWTGLRFAGSAGASLSDAVVAPLRTFCPGTVDDALPARIAALAAPHTRLDDFSDVEQRRLINWGCAVCGAAMRRHVTTGAGLAPAWPVPELRLDQ